MKELVRSYQLYDVVRERDNNSLKDVKIGKGIKTTQASSYGHLNAHGRLIAKNEARNKLTKAYNAVKIKLVNKLIDIQFDSKPSKP